VKVEVAAASAGGCDCAIVETQHETSALPPAYTLKAEAEETAASHLPHRREDGASSDKHATPA
jgi:hypothetical protein